MPLKIRPLRFEDIPATTALKFAAFRAGGRVNEAMLPLGRTPEIAAKQVKSEEDDFMETAKVKAQRSGQHAGATNVANGRAEAEVTADDEIGDMFPNETVTLVVVDERDGLESGEGEVIAMAKWQIVDRTATNFRPDESSEADKKYHETPTGPANEAVAPIVDAPPTPATATAPTPTPTPTAGWNRDLMQLYSDMTDAAQDEVMKDVPRYWNLVVLATSPSHARRGAGTLLLEWGIPQAEAQGLPIYLDGTEIGRPLYDKHGFMVKREDSIDLREWGIDYVEMLYGMVRYPDHGV